MVTACLAAGFARRGASVAALKPIASGVHDGVGEDARQIALGAGHEPRVWATFRTPVSPHRAQSLEGRTTLRAEDLHRWIASFDADVRLIEGAGKLLDRLKSNTP